MKLQRLFSDLGSMVRMASWQYNRSTAFTACLPRGISGSLSFAEVDKHSASFAAYLTQVLGLRKGERVAIQLPNSLAWPVCAFGVLRAGLILTAVSPNVSDKHLHDNLRESGARVLVTSDIFLERLERAVSHTAVRTIVSANVADFFPMWARIMVHGDLKFRGWLRKGSANSVRLFDAIEQGLACGRWIDGVENASPLTHEIAIFQHTNGTVQAPRMAMLTHANLAANVAQVVKSLDSKVSLGREVVLTPLPFHNPFGFSSNLLAFWWLGARQVLVPYPRPYDNLKRAFERNDITWLVGAVPFFRSIVQQPWFAKSPPQRLRAGLSVGMALDGLLADNFFTLTGAPLLGGYGLAETGSLVSLNAIDNRASTDIHAGFPLVDTEIAAMDAVGRVLGAGVEGEIAIRGPQVMLGYWNSPAETARTITDGWLRTGDWGTVGENGAVHIMGRMAKSELAQLSPTLQLGSTSYNFPHVYGNTLQPANNRSAP